MMQHADPVRGSSISLMNRTTVTCDDKYTFKRIYHHTEVHNEVHSEVNPKNFRSIEVAY